MAVLMYLVRGCAWKLGKLPVETAAACSISALQLHSKPDPNIHGNTKARRARELRPRRNYLLNEDVEKHRKSFLQSKPDMEPPGADVEAVSDLPQNFRDQMPEFLPPASPFYRDRVKEKLERQDMYRRREVINIPEFYVGSIMAVTMADKHAPGKQRRFVGICIYRSGRGLRAKFILRNVIDGQGVEILFDLYNPTLQKIEVLKLEKRLDDQLIYLRDAPPEYSTVPFDFQPVPLPKGAAVPVNPLKVKLKSRPWHERWERMDLKGVEDLGLPERFYKRAKEVARPWERYDLMRQHRRTIDDDEAQTILTEVHTRMKSLQTSRRWQKAQAQGEK